MSTDQLALLRLAGFFPWGRGAWIHEDDLGDVLDDTGVRVTTSTDRPAVTDNGTGLYAKLAEVTSVLKRVEKRGHNAFHDYDYVTEADLVEAVRGELTSRSIAMLASADEVTREGTLTSVRMTFMFVDGDTGEVHTASWFGTGEDKGDKGLYKAYTGALKYFLMKTFLIATGDDPERGSNEVGSRQGNSTSPDLPTDPQLDLIDNLARDLKATEADLELLRAYAAANLPRAKASGAIKALKGELENVEAGAALLQLLEKAEAWQANVPDVPADMEGLEVPA